jgi:putative SOS response-associated peptidase YedK
MCGRFTQTSPIQSLRTLFDFLEGPELPVRYNVAPTQTVAAVRLSASHPGRELALLRWGLIPSWADDPKVGNKLINARCETAADRPAFRDAFRLRRCLIPADGFYEWKTEGRQKKPFYIRRQDGKPFAFAGLWEHWEAPEKPAIESCTVLTTNANELVQSLHDRMPVILTAPDYARWLDPKTTAEEAAELLRPAPARDMTMYPVNPCVNNVKQDDARCIEPLSTAACLPGF